MSESAALLQHIGRWKFIIKASNAIYNVCAFLILWMNFPASKANSSETKPKEKSCKSFIDFAAKTNASLQSSKQKVKGLEDSRKICEVSFIF